MRAGIVGADAVGDFLSREQACGLDYGPFAMDPFGVDGIEPETLTRQRTDQDADPVSRPLDGSFVVMDLVTGRAAAPRWCKPTPETAW